ncbi:MAG: hypothetical protein ACE5JX_22950 [Acidobacteriota bacterium]
MARLRVAALSLLVCCCGPSFWLYGGVKKELEGYYVQKYKNKAIFLKIPVRGFRQTVLVRAAGPRLERSNLSQPLAFKVGDQVRITHVNFKDDFVRFKIASIGLTRDSEIVFQFPGSLTSEFPDRKAFDAALDFALTEGISYKEIDSAKEKYIQKQFDLLVEQFAATTDTSKDFVIQTLSEQNPEYLQARQDLASKENEVTRLRGQLKRESERRGESESQLNRLKRELEQAESNLQSVSLDRTSLARRRDKLERERRRLQAENEKLRAKRSEYERQVNELIEGLDMKAVSNADLGNQVQSLSSIVQDLKSQRADLSQSFQRVSREVKDLRRTNRGLSTKVENLEKARSRLASDLRALTSDKKSLTGRYHQERKENEILRTANSLGAALQLKQRRERRDKGEYQVSDVYLLSKKIGSLEVQIPGHPGATCLVRFTLDSPDTVKFTEEERRLHAALGESLRIETAWDSGAPLTPLLVSPKALQKINPRESVQWRWSFQGTIQQPTPVSLKVRLLDVNDQKILLPDQGFVLTPGGMMARLAESWSIWSLLAGLVLGGAMVGVVFALRKRSSPAVQVAPGPRRLVGQKRF